MNFSVASQVYPWFPTPNTAQAQPRNRQRMFSSCLASYLSHLNYNTSTKIYHCLKPCIIYLKYLSCGIYHTHFTDANLIFSCSKIQTVLKRFPNFTYIFGYYNYNGSLMLQNIKNLFTL